MKTPGDSMGKYLSQMIFKIILVLYIIFIATKLIVAILVENISGLSASRQARVEELERNLTGNATMVLAPSSKKTLTFGGRTDLLE
jgi:hypothetical protein